AVDFGFQAGGLECIAHRSIIARGADDFDHAFLVGGDVLGAGLQGGFHDRVLGRARGEHELAAMLEHEGDRPFLAQVAAVLGKRMAHLGHGAGAVVGHAVDDDRRAADAIAFVADFLVVVAVGAASAALDGALDVVLGHVGVGGLVPGHGQARVAVGVRAAGARRDGDLADDFGPELAPLGVLTPLAVLDIGPFAVSGHGYPEDDVGKN